MTAWFYEASTVAGGVVMAVFLLLAWRLIEDAADKRRSGRVRR